MPSYAFADAQPHTDATDLPRLNEVLAHLAERRKAWVDTSLDARIDLLDGLSRRILAQTTAWVDADVRVKSAAQTDDAYTEGLQSVYCAGMNVRLLRDTLRTLRDTGRAPAPGGGFSERADGRLVAHTLPGGFLEKLVYLGMRGEVWMQPGVTQANIADHQAHEYRSPSHPAGRTMLILGAGNQSSIPFLDAMHALFTENCVVVLKMNPVNEGFGPVLREIMADFVQAGFFEVVYGGVDVGVHLTHHALVDLIHITGSDATHDAIVWGPREGRDARKAAGERTLTKPITSELGNVSPLIIAGGEWNKSDFEHAIPGIALGLVHNASFNCIASKVLVTPAKWPQREEFLQRLRAHMQAVPTRDAYYPGAVDRWERFRAAHPNADVLGDRREGALPWLLIPGLAHDNTDELCFKTEAFCGILAEVPLPGDSPAAFLANATQFCNEVLWGTLAGALFVHPSVRRDPTGEAAYQLALDELRYGGIAVNTTQLVNYGMQSLPWGAHPGNTLEDIGSGLGMVHNALLFDRPQKSVVKMDWNYGLYGRLVPPPFYPQHRRARRTYEQLVRWDTSHRVGDLPALFANFLRG